MTPRIIAPAYVEIEPDVFVSLERAVRERSLRTLAERYLDSDDRRDFRRCCQAFDDPAGSVFFDVPMTE